jgi:hypothetical protein
MPPSPSDSLEGAVPFTSAIVAGAVGRKKLVINRGADSEFHRVKNSLGILPDG